MTKIIHPTFTTRLPSSNEVISFRPFTVREEKSLLLALQENDLETTIVAIENVISACTFEKVDPRKIPYYDSEYLFLKIRAKSVGELIDMKGSCDCSPTAKTELTVDIDEVIVEPKPNTDGTHIKVSDTEYTISIQHPSIKNFSSAFDITKDTSNRVVADCIRSVYTEDEVFNWSFDEKLDFVESMSPKQQKPISEFLKTMPMVKLKAEYKCVACGKDHTYDLSGFSNFFV